MSFLKENNLEASMSRKGNGHDNAVAESFFAQLKPERIKRKIYRTRAEARSDIFDYIELYYNPKRRHGNNVGLSPVEYEKQYYEKLLSIERTGAGSRTRAECPRNRGKSNGSFTVTALPGQLSPFTQDFYIRLVGIHSISFLPCHLP